MKDIDTERNDPVTSHSFVANGSNVDVVAELAALTGLPKSRIKHAMSCGAVWRNGKTRIRRSSARIDTGDEVTFHYKPTVLDSESPHPRWIVSNDDYSVCFKPRGVTISGSRFGDHTSLKRWVETNHSSGNAFVVHRLDRFTEGLILIAHDKKNARWYSEQFRERRIDKRYQAIVRGNIENRLSIDHAIDGKSALSHVTPLAHIDSKTLISVKIDTGRKHQIRRHLAELGFPIVGDRLYGAATEGELQLLAYSLSFQDIDHEEVAVELDPQQYLSLTVTGEHN